MTSAYLELIVDYMRRGLLRPGRDLETGEAVFALMVEEEDGQVRMVPVMRAQATPPLLVWGGVPAAA